MRAMTERTRVLVLILIMTMGLLLVTGITIGILYTAAFIEEKARLTETAQSQARLIEAVARYDVIHSADFPGGSGAATVEQIVAAHQEYEGFGNTGEFTLARRDGDLIVFVLEHRHAQVGRPEPVPFDSALAEPMRRALLGGSGTVVGLDYRGATVLAAYEPVDVIDMGIVAKIDLREVQAPFWKAGLLAAGISLLVVIGSAALLIRVSNPMLAELQKRSHRLEEMVTELGKSEERYRSIFELAAVGITHNSLEGRFIRLNQRFCEIVGYTLEEMLQLTFQDITYPDDLASDLELVGQTLAGDIDSYTMEKRYLRKDASIVWVNLTVSLARDEAGNPRYFIGVIEDITPRKRAEVALKSSLEEKEVLLREIHHRVKNNMQVISSLLSLQAANIKDERLHQLFQESQSRVRAMALIHEILYDSDDLSSIDLSTYMSRLVASLTRMYGADAAQVRLNIESDDITLRIYDMVPCGLAISELVTNSLKYAFPDGREGEINLRVTSTPEGGVELVVRDDGVGLPAELDIRTTSSMGMGLVVGLVEKQLGGRLELDRTQGTCFTITIPPKPASA
jgi:PAS domain S-box-containing protein